MQVSTAGSTGHGANGRPVTHEQPVERRPSRVVTDWHLDCGEDLTMCRPKENDIIVANIVNTSLHACYNDVSAYIARTVPAIMFRHFFHLFLPTFCLYEHRVTIKFTMHYI